MHHSSFDSSRRTTSENSGLLQLTELDELGPLSTEIEPEPETLPVTTRRPSLRLVKTGENVLGAGDEVDELLELDEGQAAVLVSEVLDVTDEIEPEPATVPVPRVDEDALTAPMHLLDMANVPQLDEIAEVEDLFTEDEVAKLRESMMPPLSIFEVVPSAPPSRSGFSSLSPFAIDEAVRESLHPAPPTRRARGWMIAATAACSIMLAATIAAWMPGSSFRVASAATALTPMSMPLVMTVPAKTSVPADDMAIVVDVAPQRIEVNERSTREDSNDERRPTRDVNEKANDKPSSGSSASEEPSKESEPAELPELDLGKVQSALSSAVGAASGCNDASGPSGVARVSITFAPSGRVTQAVIDGPPFSGTLIGSCIASKFRSASVPAFRGSPVTVKQTVTIR
ncbi:MAG: hypothetical protein U0165_01845 [Polyangiaceae bacterium]